MKKGELVVHIDRIEEKGGGLVYMMETRKGLVIRDGWIVIKTNNAYAWWGYEVTAEENPRFTGRIVAGAGNNATGQVDYIEEDDWNGFDDWLSVWVSNGWTEFEEEGIV